MLENVKVVTAKSQKVGGEVGISSDLLTALTAVPVGVSVNGSRGVSAEVSMEVPDRMVWAAQYHLVNAKHISSSQSNASDVMSKITLYPDITSKGLLRNVKASVNTFAISPFDRDLTATNEQSASSDMMDDDNGEDGTSEDGFLKAFEETIELYEDELHLDSSSEEDDD